MTHLLYESIEAAMCGHDISQSFLGILFYNGTIVERDYKAAVYWFEQAAQQGHAQAQYYLGLCYLHGNGVETDIEQAKRLFHAANAQGCAKALTQLRIIAGQDACTGLSETIYLKKRMLADSDMKDKSEKQDESARNAGIIEKKYTFSTNDSSDDDDTQSKHMPQYAIDKLAEKIDISSKGAENKQLKRNEAIRNFPWDGMYKCSYDIDLQHVSRLMDEQLYGLSVAKRQILRFLAVCIRNPAVPLRPLLLIGPPGTGKSSFGTVIAKALNKPLKRISMPSISAGFLFTGNEKYWETAGCGIIVQAIIDAGEYPVFLIDEVDKAGNISGRHSSPQHGLLNLLDDSRACFKDEFLEVPVDLQNAMFILTANDKKCVDRFILDRCKVINVEGYKDPEDRRNILEDYILPKLYKAYNLSHDDYKVPETVINQILANSIDKEGGLRVLQTQAESILQEAVLRMEINKNASMQTDLLTPEEVAGVLSEISASSKRKIGFVHERGL